jgi:O-antigen ligase
LFISGYFLPFGTFQELGLFLLLASAAVVVLKRPAILSGTFREPWVVVVLLFSLAVLAAVITSSNPSASLRAARTTVFVRVLLVIAAFNIALRNEEPGRLVRWLLPAFLLALLGEEVLNILQYLREYQQLGHLNPIGKAHIRYAGPILAILPVALMGVEYYRDRFFKTVIFLMIVAGGIMLLMTDSRSAWIGAAAGVGLYGGIVAKRRTFWLCALSVLAMVVLGYLFLPEHMVKDSVHRLLALSSSERAGNGTWGACIDIIKASPWFGHGYGREVYFQVYKTLSPLHPEWFWKHPMLPHNLLLEHWAFGGIFLLLATSALVLSPLFISIAIIKRSLQKDPAGRLCLAVCCGCLGAFLVRGLAENPTIDLYGLLMSAGTLLYIKSRGAFRPVASGGRQRF